MLSVFDIFKLGIGPSSSHTVGPMRAAKAFADSIIKENKVESVFRVDCDLYGSLSLTGLGHGTQRAVIYGLSGEHPATIHHETISRLPQKVMEEKQLSLGGLNVIGFEPSTNIRFNKDSLPQHPNGMTLTAWDKDGVQLHQETWFSVGGGFIETEEELAKGGLSVESKSNSPHTFSTAEEMVRLAKEHNQDIAALIYENECERQPQKDVDQGIQSLLELMRESIEHGLRNTDILPGGLDLPRRAPKKYAKLLAKGKPSPESLRIMDWVNTFALAVSEENAAGHRIVTAPTNGAAGIIPAVLAYYEQFCDNSNPEGSRIYLLTSAAIGMLFKQKASISGAEVGCQGEIGVACSMAAAGLTAALGGSVDHVENAAEIGMEHNLGLTCDPVKGLVQVPCIERNAMGAVKAINACRLAIDNDDGHMISLDQVIKTMMETGRDMQSKYKETAEGGLAVSFVDC